MISVQTPAEFSEKLNQASVKRRCYPWDEAVVDWSVPITEEHLYMPDEFSVFYGSPAWERLPFEHKSFITRWEFTQMMRNAGAGEHLLNQAILSVLHHTSQYDPAWRYMLHECAEECQHMAMFNAWVRLNPDIQTKGLGDDKWGLFASMLTPVLATNFPVFFWMLTMLLELAGDDIARAQAKNAHGHLHPIVSQLGKAHMIEEVRHIAFAREWVAAGYPKTPRFQQRLLSEIAERLTERILKFGLPLPYSRQVEPYVSYEEFKQGLRSEHRRAIVHQQVRPTVDTLAELGIIREGKLRAWRRAGLLRDAAN